MNTLFNLKDFSNFLSFSTDRHVTHPARSALCAGIFLEEESAGVEARDAGVSDGAGHSSRCQH